MVPLLHDKVFAVALAVSAMIHLAVLSGVPSFRSSTAAPREETYIEFLYYQMHADQPDFETAPALEEPGEPEAVDTEPVTLGGDSPAFEEEAEPVVDSPLQRVERRINVKVLEESAKTSSFHDAGIYHEGRRLNEYARTLDRIIERYGSISYPDYPRRRFIEGSVMIHLRLARDGTLLSAAVREGASSACPEFKAAALDAVRKASAHFPPFPEGIRREKILFTLPVSFILKK